MGQSKQQWEVGQTVRVGFISGLVVVAKVATPGDFKPDAYVLRRGDQAYLSVPFNGIQKIDAAEALGLIRESQAHVARIAARAIEKAQAGAALAQLLGA